MMTAASVTITPDPAYTNDDLTATPTGGDDPDGDTVSYQYQWAKWNSGTSVWDDLAGETSDTLDASNFVKDDQVRVTCTPNDGALQDAPVTGETTILNSLPETPTVEIIPGNPTTSDSLTAHATGSADADGDSVTFSYQWYKNGVLQPGLTWQRIGASRTREGQVWRCVVTPNDARADGPTGEASVTVQANTPPTAPTVGGGTTGPDGQNPAPPRGGNGERQRHN